MEQESPFCNTEKHPLCTEILPADLLSSLGRREWEHTELPLMSHPAWWEECHLSTTAHNGLSDPLADNVGDAISQHHIPFYCPCPEARIWPPNILGRGVKQPNLSQNSSSQCVSAGDNLKKSSWFQEEFIQRMVCFVSVSTNSRKYHLIKRNLPIPLYCHSKSFIRPCSIWIHFKRHILNK